jgi:prephenate dehydratase
MISQGENSARGRLVSIHGGRAVAARLPHLERDPVPVEGLAISRRRQGPLPLEISTAPLTTDRHQEGTMADTIQRVEYYYLQVPNKPGEGARVLGALQEAGINLLAISGFPEGRGSQLDFVPADAAAFKQFARKAKWKLTGPKRAFLVSGEDRVGAVGEMLTKLAAAKINVTAVDAVCAGAGRYGALLWVDPRDFLKAAKLLGAA